MRTNCGFGFRWGIIVGLMLLLASRLNATDPPGTITTVAGNGVDSFSGDGGPATNAALSIPFDVTKDSAGNLYVADYNNNRIRKVDASTGIITTVAGSGVSGFSGDGGLATNARVQYPAGVAVATNGDIYIADTNNHRVRKVDVLTGIITTFAGTGYRTGSLDGPGGDSRDDLGDGGPSTSASLYYPWRVTFDSAGNIYVSDLGNHRIRKIDASTGTISTVAGDGVSACAGESVPATSAGIAGPMGLVFDAAGNLFVADWSCHQVRKVDGTTGFIRTVAGMGPTNWGFSGDGGPATSAKMYGPAGVALDAANNLFIAVQYNGRVRRVDAGTGVITTIAGGGPEGNIGDGGPATSAFLGNPVSVFVDTSGKIFIAAATNQRIHQVVGVGVPSDSTSPVITPTITGTLGNDGWYVSNVTVSWDVHDDESAVNSTEGCETQTVTSDTTGVTFTCTATSTGGTATESVTIKRDATPPQITITSPTDGSGYLLNAAVAASFDCQDSTSGVASCSAPVASGSNFSTAPVGSKTFVVGARDNAGNVSSLSHNYSVSYNVCALYDQFKVWKSGATVPIKLQLCDASGANQSSPSIVVTATQLSPVGGTLDLDPADSGNANPDSNFRYDSALQGYIFNLSTKGLNSGTWRLSFSVSGDPAPVGTHGLDFGIK